MKKPAVRFVLVILESYENPEEQRFPLKAKTATAARKAGEALLSEIVSDYRRWLVRPDRIAHVWIEEVKTIMGLEK